MRTFRLVLAYDGTDYSGWQSQPGRTTLQGTLESALERIVGEPTRVVASGRTDAGVHALGQVVSFRSGTSLPPGVLLKALNAELPPDMAVCAAEEAAADFHALADTRSKRYRYRLADSPVRDVFERRYLWHVRWPLDAEAMHRAAQALVGRHDFSSFETSGSPRESSVRTVFEVSVRRGSDGSAGRLIVEAEANGFLYNMVRSIVGTLVEVGRGARDETWPAAVLSAHNRSAAGKTAPPQGLFLMRVVY